MTILIFLHIYCQNSCLVTQNIKNVCNLNMCQWGKKAKKEKHREKQGNKEKMRANIITSIKDAILRYTIQRCKAVTTGSRFLVVLGAP